jgi:membrane-bound ClpP family serine protease
MMEPGVLAVLFLLAAVLLIFSEVFIPSGGMITVMCVLCLIASVYNAVQAWWSTSPLTWWLYVGSGLLLLPASLGAAIQLWPYTPIGRKAEPPSPEEMIPLAEERRLQKMVGRIAVTASQHQPGGIILLGTQRIHSQSQGEIIPQGRRVKIIAAEGNRVTVREARPDEKDPEERPSATSTEENPPLDFEFPPV